ncbi:hypothetical protein [Gracilimonas mengyeensis]|uniref:ScyD/ScyE family protein n=1 Tax=Gracilimonas mengyeensis TaxID=1302730 RepID=A0A521AMS5_9BACT|nr:hypothetical protein [Gracilimonas mengyeensis]SMO36061.1 hypothetical protein SAMN06265219_101242 [Gracilimonas mengyeensis]
MQISARLGVKNFTYSIVFFCLFCISCADQSKKNDSFDLDSYARIEEPARDEVSGIVKSSREEEVYWVHGDSGTDPKIFPIKKTGKIASQNHKEGVELYDVDNNDWEEIAMDDESNLIVADIGNNCLCRDDLSLIYFPEPGIERKAVGNYQQVYIQYPQAMETSPPDAEAVFYSNDYLYIITKVDVSSQSQLYKLPWPASSNARNSAYTVTHVDGFHFDDTVTAADFSRNGDTLAVLTSSSLWMFTDFEGENFFEGNSKKIRFKADQVESVAFTGQGSVLIAEEEGQLYELPLFELK